MSPNGATPLGGRGQFPSRKEVLMSRNDPPEGTHVGGIFRYAAYWLDSIAPARPPDDHVPCLEDHRRRSTTRCSTLKAFLCDSQDTSQCDLASWSLNSERDGLHFRNEVVASVSSSFTTPLQLMARCAGPGKCRLPRRGKTRSSCSIPSLPTCGTIRRASTKLSSSRSWTRS